MKIIPISGKYSISKYETYKCFDNLFSGLIDRELYVHVYYKYNSGYSYDSDVIILPLKEAITSFLFPKNCAIVQFVATSFEHNHMLQGIKFYEEKN